MECLALVLVPIAIKFLVWWDDSPTWLNIVLIILEVIIWFLVLVAVINLLD